MDEEERRRRADVVQLREGRRVVIAGPGAGKTQLLVDHLAFLLEEGAPARSILTLVFNRRAAGELRQRLAGTLPDGGLVELRIATFHSFGLAVADRFWRRTALAGRPSLLPAAEQRAVVRALLTRTPDPDGWDVPDAVRRSESFGRNVADALLRVQEQGRGPADLAGDPALARCLARYRSLLGGRARLDHAGVLAVAAEKAAAADVRAALGIEHLLVDEYQDVNPVQEQLVERLAASARSVVVVGDPDQAIYGFRGATPDALTRAPDRLGADEVRLDTGFRCAQPIIDAAGALTTAPPLRGRDVPGGVAAAAFAHRSDELQWIADHVRRLGLTSSWGDIAILCRSLRTLRGPVTRSLQRAGIPFRVGGGGQATEPAPWVGLLLDLLEVVGRPASDDPGASLPILEAVAVSPLVAAEPLGLREAFRAARRHHDPEASLSSWAEARGEAALARLLEAVAAARREAAGGADVATVAWVLWSRLPVRERLETTPAAALPAEDVEGARRSGAWHDHLTRFVERNPGAATLADHLTTRAADEDDDTWLADRDDAAPAVQVLTVHQAKGLEFRHVVVPALEEGRFPVLARCQGLGTVTAGEAAAEERRLLYVALTRARETVTLTATLGTEDRAEASPSRFFSDLVDHLVDPDDLLPAPPADPLLAVVTATDARRTWGRALRDGGADADARLAAAAGLQALAGGEPHRLPWIAEPDLEPLRALRTTPWALSASAVATYLACGRKFLFDRVLRLAPWQEHTHGAFGTAVHHAISGWMSAGEHPDRHLLEGRLHDAFADIAEPAMRLAVQRESFRRRLPVIAEHVVERLLPELGAVLHVEQDLAVDGPSGVRLIARPDLVTEDDADGVEITDWKSGGAKGKDAGGDVQLAVYHHVVGTALDRPIRRLRLAYVGAGTWGEQTVSADHGEQCAELVAVAAGGVVEERFEVGAAPPCRHCAAETICTARPRGQVLPW